MGATATRTPSLAAPVASAPCGVLGDEERLQIGGVMELIATCADALEFSDAQRAEVQVLHRSHIDEASLQEAQLTEAERVLMDTLRPDPKDPAAPVDMDAAETQIREIGRIIGEQQLATLRTIERVKALLTPRQRAKVAALFAAHGRDFEL